MSAHGPQVERDDTVEVKADSAQKDLADRKRAHALLPAQRRSLQLIAAGQFYRSSDLVAAVHRGAGGIFEGFRAAHTFGRIYAGTFTATPAAKELARAAHFQVTPALSSTSTESAKDDTSGVGSTPNCLPLESGPRSGHSIDRHFVDVKLG
jgi:hypothetical protein